MSKCDVPPAGWACSRSAGHEGPCAATREARSALERDADVLRIGDAVWQIDGVCVHETIVLDVMIMSQQIPSDPPGTRVLGYKVQHHLWNADRPTLFEPIFVTRFDLFRRTAEVDELIAELRSRAQSLEYMADTFEEEATPLEENPRERGDDDGREYADPRDEMERRQFGED